MIPVTVQGQEQAEALRVAQLAKGKKKPRREMSENASAAHEAALAGIESANERQGPLPLGKGYAERGATMGPDEPVTSGHIEAQDFDRPYEAAGHAALSPGHGAPTAMPAEAPKMPEPRRVDLTSSRAVAHLHSPTPPGGE
jgi:hypothetical protein